jgi:hypothetical protein
MPRSFLSTGFIREMFFGSLQSIQIICLRSLAIMKRVCSARVPTGLRGASGFRGAVLVFLTRSSPGTFSVAAGWSSRSSGTKSLCAIGQRPYRQSCMAEENKKDASERYPEVELAFTDGQN